MIATGTTYDELRKAAFRIAGIQMAQALSRRGHLPAPRRDCSTCQAMGLVPKFGTRGSRKPTMSH